MSLLWADNAYVYLGMVVAVLIGALTLWKKGSRRSDLVKPVSYRYPIVGHMLDFLPEKLISTAREYPMLYGDFAEFFILQTKGLLVTNLDIAKEVMLKNPKKFRRLRAFDYATVTIGLESGLFHTNGAVWSRIRRITSPSFSNHNVQSKFSAMVRESRHWIKMLSEKSAAGNEVEMKNEALSLTLRVITAVAFGLEADDPNITYFFSKEISPMYRYEENARKATARFTKQCEQVLAYKRKILAETGTTTASAMIDSLIFRGNESHGDDRLQDQEIVANIKTFYIAGADTTSIVITWAAYYFCTMPHILHKLREEIEARQLFKGKNVEDILDEDIDYAAVKSMEYAHAVVKETLRLRSPAFMLGFELEDEIDSFELSNGILVNKNEVLWINLDGLQRKSGVFDDPNEFNPDRWIVTETNSKEKVALQDDHFMAFGYGPRICPGMTLSLTEAALALCFLAYAFDLTLSCKPEEVQRIVVFAATANKVPLKLTRLPADK